MPRRTPKPFTVEVRSGTRRKPAMAAVIEPEQTRITEWPATPLDAGPEPVTEPQHTGRILPALHETATPEPVPDPEPDAPAPVRPQRAKRTPRPKPELAAEPPTMAEEAQEAVLASVAAPEPTKAAHDAPAQPQGRPRRSRRPRSAFPLGERWKVRLPVAVFRRRSTPRW